LTEGCSVLVEQAFVAFDSAEAATNAIAKMQGFPFYGKNLVSLQPYTPQSWRRRMPTAYCWQRIAFARQISDLTAQSQGLPVEKRPPHAKKGLVAVKQEKKEGAPAASTRGYPAGSYPGFAVRLPIGKLLPIELKAMVLDFFACLSIHSDGAAGPDLSGRATALRRLSRTTSCSPRGSPTTPPSRSSGPSSSSTTASRR
jgi:hypothetical protein